MRLPLNSKRLPQILMALVIFLATGQMGAATSQFSPAGLVIRAWNAQAGLPQNTVNAIAQTQNGYLWLATQEGLARFDGVRFTTFGLQDGLPSVEVTALCEDHEGTLWIGTSAGLCRHRNGQFEGMLMPERLANSDVVTALLEDSDRQLWVGTRTGVGIYKNGNFVENQALVGLGQTVILSLAQSREGAVWIGTARGLFEYKDNHLTEISGPEGVDAIRAHCLLVDQSSNVWVSIGNGIVLCRKHDQWITYNESNGLPFDYVTCMTQESDGTIWAGSLDVGLYRFDGERFIRIGKEDGLSADDIRSLCPDREGNLWVGTRIGGLDRVSRSKLIVYGPAQGLTNDFTRSVGESEDGALWVGTIGGGLYRGEKGKFNEVPHEVPNANGASDFYFAFINSVLVTENNTVWYGGVRGLLRMQNGRLADCYTNDLFWSTSVTALCDDQQGRIWVGTADGKLVHFQNEKFTEYPQLIARGAITSLARETNGDLWVGSGANGLMHIHGDTVFTVTNGLL
ncbi:MAG: two-component regulator propeller domain-containing protein, partial [Verrucomicrobiota bacterium]